MLAAGSPRTPPASLELEVDGEARVEVLDDAWSDRLRCDHPDIEEGVGLGMALLDLASHRRRGRVVVITRDRIGSGLLAAGYRPEAILPGFYRGEEDAVIFGAFPNPTRAHPQDARALASVKRLVFHSEPHLAPESHPAFTSERASSGDAEDIASLLASTFPLYPTPTGDSAFIRREILQGMPFRVVRVEGRTVACASASLVPSALAAELSDCATHPSLRGRGLMQGLLSDLLDDLAALGIRKPFTLCRARIPGVNIAFKRLGFRYRGTMTSSCRIGTGIEDMNVWSGPTLGPCDRARRPDPRPIRSCRSGCTGSPRRCR
ncbi:MAG: GNAT family N-acetyltransferase [Deltaproteobacteria bacterium]|nr:GNAT family N-acetyltransferase [Deltaproteobacteria bacterium]